jgi:hypothetical protein
MDEHKLRVSEDKLFRKVYGPEDDLGEQFRIFHGAIYVNHLVLLG